MEPNMWYCGMGAGHTLRTSVDPTEELEAQDTRTAPFEKLYCPPSGEARERLRIEASLPYKQS